MVDFFERKKVEIGVSLSDIQRQAVEHSEGALLVLASPGSGKTTTIIMKIGYLIEEMKYTASRILAVTFSNASASDMKERFDRFFPEMASDSVNFSTIHSFAFQLVREYFAKTKQKYQLIEGDIDLKDASSYGEDGQVLNKRYILRNIYRSVTSKHITEDEMEGLLTYISFVKNKMIPIHELKTVKTDIPSAHKVYEVYEEYKKKDPKKILVDYDDMLTIANDTLDKDAGMLAKYQQKYDYVLTDESQDTSLVQNKIIEKLVRVHGNLCVVADDDQSIYTWRGADPLYLLSFDKIYPNATILTMAQNYRSTKDIVEVANQFIKRNKNRYEKNMFTEKGLHEPIGIQQFDTYEGQIRYVVEEIKKVEDLKEIAVLYRNNSSSIALINELEYAGIPFYIKDSDNKFFTHWIIEDILNFMRMSYSDKRPDLLEKIHTKFNGYITKPQVEYLKTVDNKQSVFDNLKALEMPVYQKIAMKKCKETFQNMNSMPPKKAIRVIRDTLGYEKVLIKLSERFGFKKEYLIGMLNMLEGIAGKLETLEEFVKRLTYLEDKIKTSKFNKHKNALTLSTFHSSKGLEFNRVFMIDLVNGVIPSNENIKDFKDGKIEDMEEAVRLFYVGKTRARLKLELLSYKRKDGELLQESIFVKDVREIMFPNQSSKKAHKPLKPAKKEAPTNPNAIKTASELYAGKLVNHATFGVGSVERVDDKVVAIKFSGIGIKQLAVSLCIERGLLEPSSSEAVTVSAS